MPRPLPFISVPNGVISLLLLPVNHNALPSKSGHCPKNQGPLRRFAPKKRPRNSPGPRFIDMYRSIPLQRYPSPASPCLQSPAPASDRHSVLIYRNVKSFVFAHREISNVTISPLLNRMVVLVELASMTLPLPYL